MKELKQETKRIVWHVETWPASKLKPYDKNPRIITDEGLNQLKSSFDEIGFAQPININTDGTILSGHARFKQLTKEGARDIEVYVPDRKLTPKQEEAVIVRMNKNTAGTWDMDGLLKNFNIDDLMNWGFSLEELNLPQEEAVPGCDEDESPGLPAVPRTVLGDVYELGEHRLMCGDSASITAVDKLMGKDKAAMVFTDPPYGVSYQSNKRTKSEKFKVLKNDDSFISEWINVLPTVSQGWVFVWTTWKVIKEWIDICSPIGELSNVIVWDKGGDGIGDLKKTFSTDYEMALVYHRGAQITGKRLGSVWSIGKDSSMDYTHPTQKPVALPVVAIENCTKPGDVVLDVFGGSGSTMIACEKTKRKGRTMELDPLYVDVMVSRFVKYTKNRNVILNGVEIVWQ